MRSVNRLRSLRRLRSASTAAVCLSLAIVTIASALVLSEGDLGRDSVPPDTAIRALEELLQAQADTTASEDDDPSQDTVNGGSRSVATAPVPIPPPSPVPGLDFLTPGKDEGWTPFTHWKRNADETITTEIYRVPTFRKVGSEWRSVRERIERPSVVSSTAAEALDAFRPIRLGKRNESLVRLELDEGTVTLSAPELTALTPEVSSDGLVTHRDVAKDTDLRYRVTSEGVKEELVLRSAQSPRSFRFHLADPEGALGEVAELKKGGYRFDRVIDGEVVVTIPPAYAYEDHGVTGAFPPNERGSASLELEAVEGGYDLTVAVSESWLQGRSFPIVLDPTLSFSSFRVDSGGKEMYAYQSPVCGSEGCSGNTGPATGVGSYNHAGITVAPMRAYYKFDLSSIPEQSVITNASLDLFLWGCLGDLYVGGVWTCNDAGDIFSLEARPMFEDWALDDGYLESNADVEEANVWARHTQLAFPKSQTGSGGATSPIWHRYNLSQGVQEWISRIRPNEGVQIRVAQDANNNWGGPEWPTSTSGASADYTNRPKLEVTWAAPTAGFGYEPWWSYTEEDIGPQGRASVNVANGNLVVQRPTRRPYRAAAASRTWRAAPTTARTPTISPSSTLSARDGGLTSARQGTGSRSASRRRAST